MGNGVKQDGAALRLESKNAAPGGQVEFFVKRAKPADSVRVDRPVRRQHPGPRVWKALSRNYSTGRFCSICQR